MEKVKWSIEERQLGGETVAYVRLTTHVNEFGAIKKMSTLMKFIVQIAKK